MICTIPLHSTHRRRPPDATSKRSTATGVMRSCTGCQAPRRSLCTWKMLGDLRGTAAVEPDLCCQCICCICTRAYRSMSARCDGERVSGSAPEDLPGDRTPSAGSRDALVQHRQQGGALFARELGRLVLALHRGARHPASCGSCSAYIARGRRPVPVCTADGNAKTLVTCVESAFRMCSSPERRCERTARAPDPRQRPRPARCHRHHCRQ